MKAGGGARMPLQESAAKRPTGLSRGQKRAADIALHGEKQASKTMARIDIVQQLLADAARAW
jgi:hypothetical protein